MALDPVYTISEVVIGALAAIGNALVIYVFCKYKSLRRYCNYYIVSLAIADFLVAVFGVPLAILVSDGHPKSLYGCLATVSVLMGLCYVSIVCLVGISFDRFWAITNPFAYYRKMNTKKTIGIISACWAVGFIIGFFPFFGWYNRDGFEKHEQCFFTDVVPFNYLAFVFFSAIVFPTLLLSIVYGHIYRVIRRKIRERETGEGPSGLRTSITFDDKENEVFCLVKQGEAKAALKLGLLVVAFMFCWMPLYTINTVQAFQPEFKPSATLMALVIALSRANSVLNPILYAYHLKEFRRTMAKTITQMITCLFHRRHDHRRRERRNYDNDQHDNNVNSRKMQACHYNLGYTTSNVTRTQTGAATMNHTQMGVMILPVVASDQTLGEQVEMHLQVPGHESNNHVKPLLSTSSLSKPGSNRSIEIDCVVHL